jgi:hypothetical protein
MEPIQVEGRRLNRDLATFEEDCLRLIADEIYTFNPDMILVELLADAVRLAREYGDRYPQRDKERTNSPKTCSSVQGKC